MSWSKEVTLLRRAGDECPQSGFQSQFYSQCGWGEKVLLERERCLGAEKLLPRCKTQYDSLTNCPVYKIQL